MHKQGLQFRPVNQRSQSQRLIIRPTTIKPAGQADAQEYFNTICTKPKWIEAFSPENYLKPCRYSVVDQAQSAPHFFLSV